MGTFVKRNVQTYVLVQLQRSCKPETECHQNHKCRGVDVECDGLKWRFYPAAVISENDDVIGSGIGHASIPIRWMTRQQPEKHREIPFSHHSMMKDLHFLSQFRNSIKENIQTLLREATTRR